MYLYGQKFDNFDTATTFITFTFTDKHCDRILKCFKLCQDTKRYIEAVKHPSTGNPDCDENFKVLSATSLLQNAKL